MKGDTEGATRLRAISRWLYVLQDPTRLALVLALAGGPRSVAELVAAAGVPTHNLAQHLRKMRLAGLVTFDGDGSRHLYRLLGATATAERLELCHPAGVRVTLDRKSPAATVRARV